MSVSEIPTNDLESIAFLASPEKEPQSALQRLQRRYPSVPLSQAKIVVALGGDGFMLQTLQKFTNTNIPVYGMNSGSIGFLMNPYREENLLEKIAVAEKTVIHPLALQAYVGSKKVSPVLRAINEVSLFRSSSQAAKMRISVDHKVRLPELIADGIVLATPAGSTAYNFSANGPILPLNAPLLALTPLNSFRPRRWHGALLSQNAHVSIQILETEKRPVLAAADQQEVKNVTQIEVMLDLETAMCILHDRDYSLQERILREQFLDTENFPS